MAARGFIGPARIELLPLSPGIVCRVVNLTDIQKDPFDRMIMATALNYEAKLISVDSHFIKYPELQGFLLNT